MSRILALLLLLVPFAANAQAVQQSGAVTPGHAVSWVTTGVVADGGPLAGSVVAAPITAGDIVCTSGAGALFDCGINPSTQSVPTVQQLGAKCDGSTDDTAILNTIFNNAANGVVNFGPAPNGCKITGTITYSQQAPVSVVMPGQCAASIKQVTATAIPALYFNIPAQTAQVSLFNVCFQTPTGAGAGGSGNNAVQVKNANASYFFGLTFQHGFYRDLVFTTSYTSTIENSYFGDSSTGSVDSAVVYNADKSGNNSQILASHFQNNGVTNSAPAVLLSGSSGDPTYAFSITNTDFEGNYANIELFYANSVGIQNNYFNDAMNYHFYCANTCEGIDIRANWFGAATTTNLDNLTYSNFDQNTLYNVTMVVSGSTSRVNFGQNQFLGSGSLSGATPGITGACAYPAGPSVSTVPVVTTASPCSITYEIVPIAAGGTGVSLASTGGTSQVLKQVSSGANVTVGQLACGDLSNAGTSCTVNAGTSGATIPLLNGNNTYSGTATFSSQIISTAGTPTIASGACGATTNGAVVAGSTNQSGNITIGSATTTTCVISWSTTLSVAPNACVFFPANAAAAATGTTVARTGAPSTSSVTLTGSALANANYSYICL